MELFSLRLRKPCWGAGNGDKGGLGQGQSYLLSPQLVEALAGGGMEGKGKSLEARKGR